MKRVVTQLKKRINCVDFRKIYPGFTKCNFLLRYENILYDINKEYLLEPKEKGSLWIVREQIKYVIIDYPIGNLDYDQLVIDLIVLMFKFFKIHSSKISVNYLELKYLTTLKDKGYYEHKYQQNLLAAKILSGNHRCVRTYKKVYESRIKAESIVLIEKQLEEEMGMELYIKIQATKLVKPSQYDSMIKPIICILEDPTKLFDYLSYVSSYGAALLLIDNLKTKNDSNFLELSADKLIINFSSLYYDYYIRTKKLIMYKMIHAKKVKFFGKIQNTNFKRVLVCDNLYYIPDYIIYNDNNEIKEKKGDFIVKINDNLDICESYECISLDKIK